MTQTRERFRPVPDGYPPGSKVLSRSELAAGPEALAPAAFLGRLWALLGPAAPIDDGFCYVVLDEDSGIRFSAYSGASGPSYGAAVSREALLPVVRAFEERLATLAPADCALEVSRDIEYGGGRVRMGVRAGAPFEEPVRTQAKRSQRSAKSPEDCLLLATAAGKGYGVRAGWQLCLGRVLPEPPASFELDGRCYENCVGFVFSSKGAPVFAFDEGDGLEELPVAKIPWPRPLPAHAALWLESYEGWRAARRGASRVGK